MPRSAAATPLMPIAIPRRRTHHWLIAFLLTRLKLPWPKKRSAKKPIPSISALCTKPM